MREQADMRHRVAGRIEAFELDGAADADDIALGKTAIDAADGGSGARMREDRSAGGGLHGAIAGRVVEVMMGVQDLRDVPAALARSSQHQVGIERIDRERVPGLLAGDQIVVIAQTTVRPETLYDHFWWGERQTSGARAPETTRNVMSCEMRA